MKKRALRHINSRDQRNGGFTLLELMVTVAILVILLAIGAPQLQGFLVQRTATTQAGMLTSALRMARSEAIKRSVFVIICPAGNPSSTTASCSAANSSDWSKGWLIFIDKDGDNAYSSTDELISLQQAFPGRGTLTANVAGALAFSNDGLPHPMTSGVLAPRTFTVQPDANKAGLNRCVSMGISGRTQIKKPVAGSC